MPVEIKELIIKINVNPAAAGTPAGTPSSGTGGAAGGNLDQNTIVAQCVEQVMGLLKQKMER